MSAPTRPLVSIITASYNFARYLPATLQSVRAQEYRPLEHIVIDGGSTDGTLDYLRQSGAHVRWVSEPDAGQTDALNKGLDLARGDIIGWLNADDTYEPGAVAAAVSQLQARPAAGLAFADCNFIDADGRVVDRWRTRPTGLIDLLLDGCTIAHQSAFVRRATCQAVGRFDAALRYVMDYEFLMRCLDHADAVRVDAVWGNLRVWEGTKTTQHQFEFWPEIMSMLEQFLRDRPQAPALSAELWRRAHWRYGLSAAWAEDYPLATRELKAATVDGYAYGSVAELAERSVSSCERPSYLRADPADAENLIDRVLRVPDLDPTFAAQLHAVRAFRAAAATQWRRAGYHARLALWGSPHLRRNRGLWTLWGTARLRELSHAGRAAG
jgi:glycosyltransferase involved in cell wall biosynthesis